MTIPVLIHKQTKYPLFFPTIPSSSKRKKTIKVLNYNVFLCYVVINKFVLKKCCKKQKYWRSTIGKTEYFIIGRKSIDMTIVSSILNLQDHSNLWIFIATFLMLLWGNLSWAQNRLKLIVKKGGGVGWEERDFKNG